MAPGGGEAMYQAGARFKKIPIRYQSGRRDRPGRALPAGPIGAPPKPFKAIRESGKFLKFNLLRRRCLLTRVEARFGTPVKFYTIWDPE